MLQDISPGGTDTPMMDNIKSTFTLTDEDLLPAEEVAKACISVLNTAPDVLVIIFINQNYDTFFFKYDFIL